MYVQLKLLQHKIKFQPDQLKSARENGAMRFYFALTLWPQLKVKVSENGIKWQK